MQRIALLFTALGAVLLVAGCDQTKHSSSNSNQAAMDDAVRDSIYATDESADAYASDGQYLAYEDGPAASSPAGSIPGEDDTANPPAPRTHTVARGDTLYGLARVYYDDPRQWRTIYEANRGQIDDPGQLRIGQQLTIP